MDLITWLLDWAAPPVSLAALCLVYPPLFALRRFLSFVSSLFPDDLANKVVVITGASSGIGEELVYEYARRGAYLVLVAKREKNLREVADRAEELGSPEALVVPADVASHEDCRRFIEAAVDRFGRLDHLVNNAGIANVCMFDEVADVKNFNSIMDVNYWGSVYPTYFAVPHLKRSGGKIVINSSVTGWLPNPKMSFYNASQAALISFFETLRIELGNEIGITIATPGWTESEMTRGKFLSKEGRMEVDQDTREVQFGLFPAVCAEDCAKAIVSAACKGERCVTVPSWFKALRLWRVFLPEVVDFGCRVVSGTELPPSKRILNDIPEKEMLYSSPAQSPERKYD